MENALKAQVIYLRDKDYIVRDGEVMIVDEFTGSSSVPAWSPPASPSRESAATSRFF